MPPPFPFIVGCGRSGTTLLRAMLDAHPEMAVPPESYFPVTLWRKGARRYERPDGFDLTTFADHLLANGRFRDWRLDPAAVRGALRGVEPIDYPEALRRVYGLYAGAHGKRRHGDKTPPFVLHIPLLAGLLPESRFIHLVRDGREVAMSLLEMDWGPRRLVEAAEFWAHRVTKGRADGDSIGPSRYLEVRYERLAEEAPAVLDEICRFIELEPHPSMLEYHRAKGLMVPPRERERHRHLARPPTKGLRNWREQMPPADVEVFEVVAGKALEAFGYPPGVERPSLAARARASAGLMANRTLRAARRLRDVARRRSRAV